MRVLAGVGLGAAALGLLYACGGREFSTLTLAQPDDASTAPTAPLADDSSTGSATDSGVTPPPTDRDSGTPAIDAGPACDPTADFGAPVALAALNSSDAESSISLLDDEKTA